MIRNVDRLAAKLGSLQGNKPLVLLNPGETRFCASIAMCARLLRLKEAVQDLAASDDRGVAVEKATRYRKPMFKRVSKTLKSAPFWKTLSRIVNCMALMEELLCLTDSDKPASALPTLR